MRKVKFTQSNFSEKLGAILAEFPKIEDVHPFYGDLMNVLYDRDHYKLALGQGRIPKTLAARAFLRFPESTSKFHNDSAGFLICPSESYSQSNAFS